jgi:WXXGXW repeat (2 copies)
MRFLRSSARWLLLALLISVIPASQARAGVIISVGFAPPVLPVYVQPICPQPGLMWTPGYWAYGPDGYFWVPGAWVPAPYMGALWTPPYWGWEGGNYLFHGGYWGPHVGYYGGINYGFGYGGIGFAGGMWRGGVFAYNTAIMRVGSGGAWGNRVYVDREVINRTTIINNNRVAFNGGPNGIRYQASAQERSYMNERHVQATSFQTQHEQTARGDRMAYAKANNGRPQNLVASRPLQQENRPAPGARPGNEQRPGNEARPAGPVNTGRPGPATRPPGESRPAYNQPGARPAPETRPSQPATRPAPESRPSQPTTRPAPEQRPAPAQRPAPQQHTRPAPQPHPQQERPHEPKGR